MTLVLQNGWSPLMVASEKGHLKVVNMLIEAGANISQSNKVGLILCMYIFMCVYKCLWDLHVYVSRYM